MNEEIQVEEKKKKPLKYILSILFLIGMIIFTFIMIFKKYEFKDLWNVIKNIDYKYIIIGLFMIFIYIFFEGMATREILKAMGSKTSVIDNVSYAAIDYYFCSVTPSATGGQPMAAYYMVKDDISISNTSITLLLNTALFKIVLLILSIISAIVAPKYIFHNPLMIVLYALGFFINVFLIVMCFLGAFKSRWLYAAGKKITKLLYKMKIIKKPLKAFHMLEEKMNEYEESGKLVKAHKKEFFIALIYNLIQRVALFSVAYLVFVSFYKGSNHNGLTYHNYFQMLSVQVAIALCVDSLPLPGGVGISEVLYQGLFALIYNTDTIAASAMLLTRGISFYIPLIITFIIWIIKHIILLIGNKKTKIIKGEINNDRIL